MAAERVVEEPFQLAQGVAIEAAGAAGHRRGLRQERIVHRQQRQPGAGVSGDGRGVTKRAARRVREVDRTQDGHWRLATGDGQPAFSMCTR
jgi:hypothetical protein